MSIVELHEQLKDIKLKMTKGVDYSTTRESIINYNENLYFIEKLMTDVEEYEFLTGDELLEDFLANLEPSKADKLELLNSTYGLDLVI